MHRYCSASTYVYIIEVDDSGSGKESDSDILNDFFIFLCNKKSTCVSYIEIQVPKLIIARSYECAFARAMMSGNELLAP